MNDEEYMYCTDCKRCTNQKYHGRHADNIPYFLCKECGCENDYIEDNGERLDKEDITN